MSDDIAPSAFSHSYSQSQLSPEDIISLAREAIETSRDEVRRSGEGTASTELQQPGVTVDLGHKNITRLPEEVIDIIKDEIERLAISHNRVSTFPARLAECKRLRYLNVRYNHLKEVPRPVLQLTSLEILDLSRNRLRVLPEEIRYLTSLKVLAIQRNKIERLPLCLGDMTSLRMLKLDENPLIFPPFEVCNIDPNGPSPASIAEREAHITSRVKKYLRQHSSAHSNRRQLHVDSDGESSEGQVETPRPFRPAGTRFPVKPSLSGLDTASLPSTSPEPPPPIPVRSHQRIISNQSTHSRRPTLLSPPDADLDRAYTEFGLDVTVRPNPKRHGIITPRGPEGVAQTFAMSPSALQDTFSNMGSAPHSRTGSGSSAIVMESFVETVKLVQSTLAELCDQLNSISPLLEFQNQISLRSRVELELRTATSCADLLSRGLRRTVGPNSSKAGFLHRSVLDCLTSTSRLSRLLSRNVWIYIQQSPRESFRALFWDVQKDGWEMFIAISHMSNAAQSTTHYRQTSNSSRFNQGLSYGGTTRNASVNSSFDSRIMAPRNGLSPSPTLIGLTILSSTSTTFGNAFSPIGPSLSSNPSFNRPNLSMVTDGPAATREDESRQEAANDTLWDTVYTSLRTVCDRANNELPKIQKHYYNERQKAVHIYDPEHEVVRLLGGLVWRTTNLIDASEKLSKRLDTLRVNDRSVRHSSEFWQLCRNLLVEWSNFIDKVKSLGVISHHADVKPIMKAIHVVAKETTSSITASPWGSYLHNGNHMGSSGIHPPRPQHPNSGTLSVVSALQSQSANMGSIPSTPLSAALGPAALATVPSKGGQSRSAINFFERADRYAASQQLNHRGGDGLYGRR